MGNCISLYFDQNILEGDVALFHFFIFHKNARGGKPFAFPSKTFNINNFLVIHHHLPT